MSEEQANKANSANEQATHPHTAVDPKAHPKERVLAAALELFVAQGYFNTNIPDISKRSNCSVGSIYHHFVNKEEIASSLYMDGIHQFRAALDRAISEDQSFDEMVRAIVTSFLDFASAHEQLSRYLWLSRHNEFLTAYVGHPTRVGFDSFGRKFTRAISQARKTGSIPEIRADILWSIIFGIPVSYVRDWLDGYTNSSPHTVSDLVSRAVVAALHGSRS